MKKLLAIIALVSLSGCATIQSTIDRFTIAPFDTNEYALVVSLRTLAMQAKPFCGGEIAPFIHEIQSAALVLKNYSQHLPKNEQSIKPINLVYDMAVELQLRSRISNRINKTYCELKTQSIADSAETIQRAIGKRPRP